MTFRLETKIPVTLHAAWDAAAEVEKAIGEIANRERKPAVIPLEPLAQLVQFARDCYTSTINLEVTPLPEPDGEMDIRLVGRDVPVDVWRASSVLLIRREAYAQGLAVGRAEAESKAKANKPSTGVCLGCGQRWYA